MPRPRPVGDISDQLTGHQASIAEAEPIDEHRQALIEQLDAIFAESGVNIALDSPGADGTAHGLHLLHQPLDSPEANPAPAGRRHSWQTCTWSCT